MADMSEMTDWVERLKGAKPPYSSYVPTFHRITSPGWEPLDFGGFVKVEGQGVAPLITGTPRGVSVLGRIDIGQNPAVPAISLLPTEIGALMSLVADRKIEVHNELSAGVEGTNTQLFLPISHQADARLVSPISLPSGETVDSLFRNSLSQLCSLKPKQQKAISQAVSLHYGAVLLYESDLAAAYALIVAGIETLSRVFSTPPTGWSKWDQSQAWDEFMKGIELTGDQKIELRDRLLKDKQILLKQTFVNYAVQEVPDSMWEDDWREWMYQIDADSGQYIPGKGNWSKDGKVKDHLTTDRDKLRTAIKKSYDARSGFVHEGKRGINLMSHIQTSLVADYTKPLPFSHLRTILSTLIKYELARQSEPYNLPDIFIER